MARIVSTEESRLRLRADGTWTYKGVPATHAGVRRFFTGQIRRDDQGEYYLFNAITVPETGVTLEEHVYFEVEDTAFRVQEIQWDAEAEAFWVIASPGGRERLDTRSLHQGEAGILYCQLHSGDRARFTRGAMAQAAAYLGSDDAGFYLRAGATTVRIASGGDS